MLNLDMFGRGNQPALDSLPTLKEDPEEDSDASSQSLLSGEEFDSDFSSNKSTSNEGTSTTDLSTTHRTDATAEAKAYREAKALCWLRGIVLVALLAAMGTLAIVVHHSLAVSQQEQFEAQFHDHASKIFSSFEAKIERGLGQIDNLGLSFTSYSRNPNVTTWPSAAIPEFQMRAESTRKLDGSTLVAFVPVIQEFQRAEWESFVVETTPTAGKALIAERHVRALQTTSDGVPDMEKVLQAFFDSYGMPKGQLVNLTDGVASAIYRMDGVHKVVENKTGPYYPIWQSSPQFRELVNFNLISDPKIGPGLKSMITTRHVTIGKIADDITATNEAFNVLQQELYQGRQIDGPTGTILFPIFNAIQEPRALAGIIFSLFPWNEYLSTDMLPNAANGIMCVLSNECNQEYTFEVVNQGAVVCLGAGDLHDTTFDYLEENFAIQPIIDALNNGNLSYSGATIDSNYCPYRLRVYPTSQVRETYITKKPITYTIIVIVVFLVAALVFVIYDILVEKRQKILVSRAVKSHQIVSSLFPALVRDRLFGDDKEDDQNENHHNPSKPLEPIVNNDKLRLKKFLNAGVPLKDEKESKPIADLFSHCTVLFADIAGFTAWSSVREPAQVFILLENIYSCKFRLLHLQINLDNIIHCVFYLHRALSLRQDCSQAKGFQGRNYWRLLRGGDWLARSTAKSCNYNDSLRKRMVSLV